MKEIQKEAYTEPETVQEKDSKQTAAADLSKRLKDLRSLNDAASLKGISLTVLHLPHLKKEKRTKLPFCPCTFKFSHNDDTINCKLHLFDIMHYMHSISYAYYSRLKALFFSLFKII